MADEKDLGADRGFTGSIFKALGVPGGLAREAGLQLLEGQFEGDKFADIVTGDRETSARDMFERLEDITGQEGLFTPENKLGRFALDFVGDVLTSPDSLLGAPLKLARAGKVLDGLNNPIARKAAESAITGGTIGLLSADSNDDLLDVAGKVATGAALGSGARGVVSAAAPGLQKHVLNPILDGFVNSKNKNIANIAKGMTFTEASDIRKATEQLVRSKSRLYHDEVASVQQRLADDLLAGGADEKQVEESLNLFNELKGDGFSRTVDIRNSSGEFVNGVKAGNNEVTVRSMEEMYSKIEPTLGDQGAKNAIQDFFAKTKELEFTGNKAADGAAKQRLTTKFANDIATAHTLSKAAKNPRIQQAIKEHVGANTRLVSDLNAFNAGTKFDNSIVPVALHTVDLKNVEKFADEDLVKAAKGGLQRRFSDEVKALSDNITREQVDDIGADRFARLYMTDKQLRAKALLNQVSKNLREGTDKGSNFIKFYDDMTQLMKTTHLTMGLSWIRNNYTGNLVNAVVGKGDTGLGGLSAAGSAGLESGKAIGQSVLKSAGDLLDADILKDLAEKGTAGKMMKAMSGKGKKLNFKDDDLNTMADLGLIDSDKIRDMANLQTRGLQDVLTPSRDLFGSRKVQNINDFFWEHVGRVGSLTENTFKVQTFRDVLDSVTKVKYPKSSEAFKKYKKNDILNREIGVFKEADRAAVGQAKQALNETASTVNGVYFDYGNVSAFERSVMKRIFPYWTFMSRNFKLWTDIFADRPEFAAFAAKLPNNLGRELTNEERLGLPEYIKELGARIPTEPQEGENLVTATIGSFPIIEALKNVKEPLQTAIGGASPIVKSVGEQLLNIDSFTGRAVRPTDEQPTVRVQEQLSTLLPDAALEQVGIKRKDDGKLVTGSGVGAFLGKVIPGIPVFDDLARANRDTKADEDKNLIDQFAQRQLNPVRFGEFEPQKMSSSALRKIRQAQRREVLQEDPTQDLRRRKKRRRLRRRRRRRTR